MSQLNGIIASNLPGIAIGDAANHDTVPDYAPTRGQVVDAGGGLPTELPVEDVTAAQWGAIGDGSSHPLSERFNSLIRAQTFYPDAVSLSQEIDYCAMQKLFNRLGRDGRGIRAWLGARPYVIGNNSIKFYDSCHFDGAATGSNQVTGKGAVIRTRVAGDLAGLPMIDVSNTRKAGVHWVALSPVGVDPTTNTTLGISDFTDSAHGAAWLHVEHCYFRYFGGVVVGLFGGVNTIVHSRADDSNSHFIHLKNSGVGGSGVGSDNFVLHNESGAGWGNVTDGGAGALGTAYLVEGGGGNTLEDNRGYNFKFGLRFITVAAYNRAVANRFEKNDLDGIVDDGGVGNELEANMAYNNAAGGTARGIVFRGGARDGMACGNLIANEPTQPNPTGTDIGIAVIEASTGLLIAVNKITNVVQKGILLDTATYITVQANATKLTGQEGLAATNGASNNAIGGNSFEKGSQSADNTYSGMLFDSNSDANSVIANRVRHGGGAAQFKWALRINNVNCDANVLLANDLTTGGRTANLSDGGTGTVNTGNAT